MRLEPINVEAFTIHDAPNLDPITVILQDLGHGRGRLILECYGEAFSAYWGAMSDPLRVFVRRASADYIVNRLMPLGRMSRRAEAKLEGYLRRIVDALQAALRAQEVTP